MINPLNSLDTNHSLEFKSIFNINELPVSFETKFLRSHSNLMMTHLNQQPAKKYPTLSDLWS